MALRTSIEVDLTQARREVAALLRELEAALAGGSDLGLGQASQQFRNIAIEAQRTGRSLDDIGSKAVKIDGDVAHGGSDR